MPAAGGWDPKLPGFDSIEVYGPMPRGVDPATADYTLPAPGELAFKGPVPFGNGQTLHDQLVEAVDAEPNIRPFFAHRAQRLIEEDGRIVGVLCDAGDRSEEHTSELQSLMRISYAVFCLKKKKNNTHTTT